ncbi:thioredoxin domain-containing protein [Myxococcota bacterium]|nr:thioredoxin domain-containing protein [Myxococcota bacterium]
MTGSLSKLASFVAGAVSISALVACQGQGAGGSKPATQSATSEAKPAAGTPSATSMRLDPNKVVLSWSGGKMTYGELHAKKEGNFKKLYNKYMNDLYASEQQELEEYILQTLVEKAAKDAGKTADEFVQGLAGSPTVTDQDVQDFYDKNVKQSGQPFEAVKDRIKPYLEGQKKQEAVRAAFDKLKADAQVKIDLPPPETSKASFDLAGKPSKGPDNAKVTIVEFSDFECPYCSRAVPGVEKVLAAYPNDVRVVFLHYPLSFHKGAMPSAIAATCAHQQGKFWPFHDKLFANQHALGPELFNATAKELGLDEAKFSACLADPKTKETVDAEMAQGNAAGVEGTPSFFINGVQYAKGVPSVEDVKAAIDRN